MTQSGELFQSLNSNGKNLQVNTQVITLTDNLSHPYFSIINLSKNNSYPIGSAILESAYTPYISNYWIKYKGIVIISFDLVPLNQTNTTSEQFLESNKINGEMPIKQDKLIQAWIQIHKEELNSLWILMREENEYFKIKPLD